MEQKEQIQKVLTTLGFSEGEQKVYIALLELGESTSGPIAEHSGVSASKVYQVIERLTKKGLVGSVQRKGVQHFTAVHPKALLDYVEAQEQELQQVKESAEAALPLLTTMYEERTQETEVQLLRGMKSFRNIFNNMLDELGPEGEYHVIGASIGIEGGNWMRDFFTHYHAERRKRGVKAKLLFQQNTKPVKSIGKEEYRHLPPNFDNPMQINVYRDVVNLILMVEDPLILHIKNKHLSKGFEQYFQTLWNQRI